MLRCLLLALLALHVVGHRAAAQAPAAPTGPAAASTPSDAVTAMIGTWEFTNSGRDKVCTVRFGVDTAVSGMKLEFDAACSGLFAFVGAIAGWTIAENDFLRLVDGQGRPVLEFSEVEHGLYEAPKPGEGILFIQKPTGAPPPATRTAAEMSGEWIIARENRARLCGLTLTDTAAGDDFAVRVNPPCDAAITRFGPTTWQLDRGEIVLKSARGQTWRFEEGEARAWRRVGLPNPVLLLRR
jgi:hypothetical protein